MKITKNIDNAVLVLKDYTFGTTQNGNEKLTFRLNVKDQVYDDFYVSVFFTPKNISFTLSIIRKITGWVGDNFEELLERKNNFLNRQFKASIDVKPSEKDDLYFYNLSFEKETINLKDLTNKFKKDLIEYSSKHQDGNLKTDDNDLNDIPF